MTALPFVQRNIQVFRRSGPENALVQVNNGDKYKPDDVFEVTFVPSLKLNGQEEFTGEHIFITKGGVNNFRRLCLI
jgi:hypothetical protein